MSYSLPLASLIIGVVDGLGAGVTNTKSVLYRSCGSQQNYAPNFQSSVNPQKKSSSWMFAVWECAKTKKKQGKNGSEIAPL